ncbi:MAG: SusC/RagA family TonB-linked outer membrane protein [Bacteroidota bacterium]
MKRILFILALLSVLPLASGQKREISGKVTDGDTGEALPGVGISVKGTTTGTITDFEGSYRLSASAGDVLVFSFVGYQTREFTVAEQSTLDVYMKADIQNLEEIVVIGYGTVKKSDITGSVASVRPGDFNPGPVVSLNNYLQNTAPGVVMLQSSSQPGGSFDVKIRGTSSLLGNNGPLYVIDGLPVTSDNTEPGSGSRYRSSPPKNPLNGINPEDIVSIEVLKDASATAIYGARGANGVILITTRTGESGKMVVEYSGSTSIQHLDKRYDMLNAKQFATLSNEYHLEQNPGTDPIYSPAEINRLGEGTDWIGEITRLGSIQKQQFSISGGKPKFRYYASANLFDHQGIVYNSSLRRYSGRFNISSQLTKNLKLGASVTLTNMKDRQVPFGATGGGGPEFSGLFDNTRTWSPLVLVRQPDGSFSRHPEVDNIPNPVSLLDIDDRILSNRIMGTTFLEYQVFEGLTAKVNLGMDYTDANRESLIPLTVIRGEQANGEAEIATTRVRNVLSEFTLNYNKMLFGNKFDLLVGNTYQQFDSEGDDLLMSNFADHASTIAEIQYADTLSNTRWRERSRLISYIGRMNYNIRDRYLFTVSFRADGSTKFGANHKWGYFPSAAFAWNVHNESFFNSGTINSLKIRISYGQIGNQEIGNKRSQSLYSYTRRAVIGGIPVSGYASLRPENPDLKWETSTQANFGVDMSVLGGRIQTTFELYRKLTSDVLLEFYLPSTSGYSVMTKNAGTILNRGAELNITSVNIPEVVEWKTSFNIAYNKNSWLDRAGYYPVGMEVEEENATVNGIYGYIVDGIFTSQEQINESCQPDAKPGMFIFRDVSGDGEITPADRTLLGKNDPDFTLGLNNSFQYKKFDLSFFFQGMFGRQKDNYTLASLEDIQNILLGYNKSVTILDRWTDANPDGTVQGGLAPSDGGDNYANTVYIQNASFVRLRNVTLGYSTSNLKFVKNLRIYFDAQNLLTITPYRGLDPETDEFRQYPNARTYSIGVNITF